MKASMEFNQPVLSVLKTFNEYEKYVTMYFGVILKSKIKNTKNIIWGLGALMILVATTVCC